MKRLIGNNGVLTKRRATKPGSPLRRTLLGRGEPSVVARFVALILILQTFLALPAAAQTITPLAFDQPATGQITRDVFRQVYTFSGRAADVISLIMTATSGLDPLLIITDDQNQVIARDDDGGKRFNAAIESLPLPHDGTFFVIATRFGQERGLTTGAFTLTLSHAGVTGADNASVVLHYGDSLVGQIGDVPEKVYAFSATRGDLISITMQRISGDLDPFVILADASGTVQTLSDDDPASPGTLDAGLRDWLIRKSGNYLIVATRFGRVSGQSAGAFSLALDRVAPAEMGRTPERAALLDYGASAAGTIDGDNAGRYYRFEAHKGDVITLTAERTRGNLDPTLTLFSADLKKIADHDQGQRGQSARISAFTAPKDADYLVLVSRYAGDAGFTAGDYSLSLVGRQGVTVGPNGVLLLAYGSAVSSSIDRANPSQEYVFQSKAGDLINLEMSVTTGDLEPQLLLFDATRHLLAQVDPRSGDAQIAAFKLPAKGAYIVLATRHGRAGGTTSGSYLLTLTQAGT